MSGKTDADTDTDTDMGTGMDSTQQVTLLMGDSPVHPPWRLLV